MMTTLRNAICLLLLLISGAGVRAQILNISPVFPTVDDTITVTYDATQGNGELVGVSPVFAHAGLITSQSTSPSDWKYVQGNWGTNDPQVLMQNLGNNQHRIKYHIRSFYDNVPANVSVLQLAYVFRNQAGNKVGRDASGADIYYPIWDGSSYDIRFLQPEGNPLVELGNYIPVRAAVPFTSSLQMFEDGNPLTTASGKEINYTLVAATPGKHWIKVTGIYNGQTYADSFSYIVRGPVVQQNPPAGIKEGINYLNDSTVALALYAPRKDFVYVIGDFNQWQPDPLYYMKRSADSTLWWVEISGLTPGEEYGFQYFIDGTLRLADAYADKVLDQNNDPFLSTVYPGLKPYPANFTSGIVSVLQTAQTPYIWQNPVYERPANSDLIIYELHVRDFVARHDYKTLIDSLSYLQNLGVNAIELMPVMEFEGNNSWGYNPSFFFAPDKYYGKEADLKAFIDSCHGRGIVVILDMVLNHAFSQCPLTRLYWDAANSRPSPDNPWFNPEARHPFSVGYDFNHESAQTQKFVDRVLSYWVSEYKMDGYRMDLSKGFTQVNSGTNVGLWGQRDTTRIRIIKRMFNKLRQADPGAYFILEHFADNSEEKELAEYGMMLWGNHTYNYGEAVMGYINNSNFQWISYQNRGWAVPHAVGYMESHDEERLTYKSLSFGNSATGYNTRDLNTALARLELAGTFFFTVPGPKMIWQFGELGYDVSIDFNGRTGEKPIRWNYLNNYFRSRLYSVWKAVIDLRSQNEAVFRTQTYNLNVGGAYKRIGLTHSSMDVVVLGNFAVTAQSGSPAFQHTGYWYEYFSGDSLNVTDVNAAIPLAAGEYRIYTDQRLTKPDVTLAADPLTSELALNLFPNPASQSATLSFELDKNAAVKVEVLDLSGRVIEVLLDHEQLIAGTYRAEWDLKVNGQPVSPGLYVVRIRAGDRELTRKLEVKP